MANFCTNCGTKLDNEDNFCTNCGAKVEKIDEKPKGFGKHSEIRNARKELKEICGEISHCIAYCRAGKHQHLQKTINYSVYLRVSVFFIYFANKQSTYSAIATDIAGNSQTSQ